MARKKGYQFGDEFVARKHLWLPCVLSVDLEGASDEEKARLYRATWWADNITNAEWPALLGRPEGTRPNKSRLKRKLVGWLMALGRVAALNPELFDQACREARDLYAEQLDAQHPLMATVPGKHPGEYLLYRFDATPQEAPP
jgi:hypothetical protein